MPVHDWTRVGAGTFHGFHTTWIGQLGIALDRILPADYYAEVESNAFGWIPDLLTLGRGGGNGNGPAQSPRSSGAGSALSLTAAPPQVEFTVSRPAAARQRRLAIRRPTTTTSSPPSRSSLLRTRRAPTPLRQLVDKAGEFLGRDQPPGNRPVPADAAGPATAFTRPSGARTTTRRRGRASRSPLVAYRVGEEVQAYVRSVAVGDPLPDMPLCLEGDATCPCPWRPRTWPRSTGTSAAGETS